MLCARKSLMALFIVAMLCSALAAQQTQLLAEWNFDEGKGTIAHDSSGMKHDATLIRATWEPQGKGYALCLNGIDDYVECGQWGVTGPITVETWLKPMRKAQGLSCIIGSGLQSFLLTYYNTERCEWYIGAGSNNVHGPLTVGAWQHVVATFDGNRMSIWINGRLMQTKESEYKTYLPQEHFVIGTQGQPQLPRFKGMLDRMRIYNRALSGAEAQTHFRAEASEYGFDPAWFTRLKATPYCYLDRRQIVVDADYRQLLPLAGKGSIEVALVSRQKPQQILHSKKIENLSAEGMMDVVLPIGTLADGEYVVRVTLSDDKGARPVEEFAFSSPERVQPVAAPAEKVVGALPEPVKPTPFDFKVSNGGGFEVTVNGVRYPFQSRISWPNGKFNRLSAMSVPWPGGEQSWRVRVTEAGENHWTVDASGGYYRVSRDITRFPTHVYIKDTYTNIGRTDLGLLIYNETPLSQGQAITGSWLSGYDRRGRQAELTYPDYSPNAFFTDKNTGMGIMPMDDVYIVQAMPYVDWEGAAGVGDEKFALAPQASYMLEWAVYPTASRDYYDYINTFRKVEGRIGTVTEAPGFIGRRSMPDPISVRKLQNKISIIPGISNALDDTALYIEGTEFVDFPKEMAFLKKQAADVRAMFPGMKVIFHIAHSLYCTNKPERFADSKVITADGKQATWADGSIFGKEHQDANWRWWIFYPTPGNSFHDAMMKSVDVMMDEMGMNGGFMDGFLAGYSGHWSYDTNVRWDGHSAEIDTNTKTITRKMNSVILLSQPSMIEYARKILSKGGVVIANNNVFTRTLANEKGIFFDNECASGPELHLAPSVTALASPWGPSLKNEIDVYRDMLDKLKWGELWFSYGEPWARFSDTTSLTLAAREYPMTFEEIRSGMVRGKERIVTMNSGVYGWPGERNLHLIYKFDSRGAPVAHGFVTTSDKDGVRTELRFAANESAVIEPVPLALDSAEPVNVRVTQYDVGGLRMLLNGQGAATLKVAPGAFQLRDGESYGVTAGGIRSAAVAKNNSLEVPLKLEGPLELAIETPRRLLTVQAQPEVKAGILGSAAGCANYTTELADMTSVTLAAPPFAPGRDGVRGFIATQNSGDGTLILDAMGNRVKVLDHGGRAMAFDRDGNLFVADNTASGGKYPVWRYSYQGGSNWAPAEKYCETEGLPRAVAMDSASGVLYIGMIDAAPWLSNVYRCMKKGDAPALFCGVNDGSRQIQDMEVGPDGRVWVGLMAWGYLRFPLTGGFKPDLRVDNKGNAGGFAFGPDRNGDGAVELYGNANETLNDFGWFNASTGDPAGKLFADETGKLGNYCMTFGPDRNDNGFADIYVCAYEDRMRIFDGLTGARLGEIAEKCPNWYLSGWTPASYRFVRWTLDGVAQPDGQSVVNFSMTGPRTVVAQYEPVARQPAGGR